MNSLPLLQRFEIDSVAVLRALRLGDMLCAVPALRALRGALPHARIVLIGLPWAQQFADRFGRYIDEFIAFPCHAAFPEQPVQHTLLSDFYGTMRARRFSLGLQLHGSGEVSNAIVQGFGPRISAGFARRAQGSRRLWSFPYPEEGAEPSRLLRLVTLLGAPPRGSELEFPLHEQDGEELARSALASGLRAGSYICIHPGAGQRDKCWPAQRFAEVADRLADEFGLDIVLTGSAAEADLTAAVAHHMRTPAIDAAGPISIGAMAALMGGARLLVCNDTGVSHIAAGLRLKSVVVFCKADISRWAPLDRQLHRCIADPEGRRADAVLSLARSLLW
jgi:ADP-heptose:LPS heptosyltransferase